MHHAASLLRSLGHRVEAANVDLRGLGDVFRVMVEAESAANPVEDPAQFSDPYSRWCYERGMRQTAVSYIRATEEMVRRSREIIFASMQWDCLLTPTVTLTPQPLDTFLARTENVADDDLAYIPFTYPFNISGQPAISLPLGWSGDGLPIGVQLVGHPYDEALLIALAAQIERAAPWASRYPAMPDSTGAESRRCVRTDGGLTARSERAPMPLNLPDRFARTKLGFFPSPLHPLPRLSRELGMEVWAKRDDVSSGLAFGGNKVRKLEFLAADALAQNCDTLVSIGNIQSNHTRQVAAVAAALGLKCRLVQEEWTKWDDPVYGKVGNILLSRIMGAQIVEEGEGYSTAIKQTFERALDDVRRAGGRPYAIPAGASDHPLGGLGYAHFADELAAQETEVSVFFDTIITATCTGSTQAGMVVGFLAQDRNRRLIGIDTAANAAMTREAVTKIARATAELVGLNTPVQDADIVIDPRFCGPDYGLPDDATIAAIRTAAQLEGMLTDPVYEGKSMAGLIGMARAGEIPPGAKVLYVHLGGAPALNAYHAAFTNQNDRSAMMRR